MRIQGELKGLGISVAHTTIANGLRSSGLGPAPRRSGPSWSEFLHAQAHSLVAGGLS
jgi:putative transposase